MLIQMETKTVLELLKDHKEKHIQEFSEQMQGWKKAMEQFAVELSEWKDSISDDIFAQSDKDTRKQRPVEPQRPISFVKDYDKLIELVEHHVGDKVEIEQYEFDQIVKDEFGWKGQFLSNSALYSNSR